LIPTVMVDVNDNGSLQRTDGTPRDPQTFVLIPLADPQQVTPATTGVARLADYVLLGVHTANVAVGDHWSDAAGNYFEVVSLGDGFGYQVKALVASTRFASEVN